jgi:hypothetical protein
MVDTTSHNPESRAAESFVEFTSADGLAWGAGTPTQFSYGPSATLADGITFSLSWTESQAGVVRSHADGTSALFELEDLAPDLDTRGYQLAYVATGEYGVVITAISWEDSNDSMPGYDSLVLYSPDGTSWGATELPDVEVVQTVVTNDGVLIFLNDPAREEGAPQPVLYGR